MAHSIELLFDEATEMAVRRDWTALAQAGLPSQGQHRSATNRPHVTMAVSRHIDPAVDVHLSESVRLLPLDCRIGAVMVFGHTTVSLVRLIVPSTDLLELHGRIASLSASFQTPGPYPHSQPGQWTPHVTLCRRLSARDLPAALETIRADDVVGTFAGLRRWDGDARVDTLIG
jgi:2'-5' RNA ligase